MTLGTLLIQTLICAALGLTFVLVKYEIDKTEWQIDREDELASELRLFLKDDMVVIKEGYGDLLLDGKIVEPGNPHGHITFFHERENPPIKLTFEDRVGGEFKEDGKGGFYLMLIEMKDYEYLIYGDDELNALMEVLSIIKRQSQSALSRLLNDPRYKKYHGNKT